MTPEQIKEQCTQAHDQLLTFDLPVTLAASEALYLRNMATLESLYREAMAAGLEMVRDEMNYGDRNRLQSEWAEWCHEQVQAIKGGG